MLKSCVCAVFLLGAATVMPISAIAAPLAPQSAPGVSSVRGSWGAASGSGPAWESATGDMLAQPIGAPREGHIGLSGEAA